MYFYKNDKQSYIIERDYTACLKLRKCLLNSTQTRLQIRETYQCYTLLKLSNFLTL